MLKKLKAWLLEKSPLASLIALSKRIYPPGFDDASLYNILEIFFGSMSKGSIQTRASSLAFRFFLALFPAIIFLFSLIPHIPIADFTERLLTQLQLVMPAEAYELSKSTIIDLTANTHDGLLSFGFLFTIYLATNGINAMIEAFNQSYYITEKRSFIKQRLAALALMAMLTTGVMLAVFLIIFSGTIVRWLLDQGILMGGWDLYLLEAGKWLIILSFFYFSVSSIYYIGPSKKEKYRFFSAGSSMATILIILVSFGFAYYVNHFGNYNRLYGSIGTLIVIMLWIYFNCLILLVGFELNVTLKRAKAGLLKADPGESAQSLPPTAEAAT